MTQTEFRNELHAFKAIMQPMRKSKPGIALCFDHPSATRAHNQIQSAKAWLRNVEEDRGVSFEAGGTSFDGVEAERMIKGISRKLAEAGAAAR